MDDGSDTIRVLIAEDSRLVREALAGLVRASDGLVLVDAVGDATEAVAAAGRSKPDVALVDVRMPGGGGAAAARGIRQRSPDTRVLALSGQGDRESVLQMVEAGAVGYLVKGGPPDAIIDSIRRAAAGQGSLSGEVTAEVIDELAGELVQRADTTRRNELREERIRRAIDDESVLEIVFQPICTLGGEMVGAEALARFHATPQRGPDKWFAEAAEVGLGAELELTAVAVALANLPALPSDLFLAVNASPLTVMSERFRSLFSNQDAKRIVVEITEHAAIDDYELLKSALDPLRELGLRLAVDDAGAGFASLRHILNLAPDIIKLDRTLIDRIDEDRSRQALAAGLISFAEKIEATIVAEGIEREAEVSALIGLGVGHGQGYFFARPGPLPLRLEAA
jgi:EAL domain-containing protein (putative c-di-GMP-specific phosphodiesterase class I)/DNA-binding NarL/FixJ family response regulator